LALVSGVLVAAAVGFTGTASAAVVTYSASAQTEQLSYNDARGEANRLTIRADSQTDGVSFEDAQSVLLLPPLGNPLPTLEQCSFLLNRATCHGQSGLTMLPLLVTLDQGSNQLGVWNGVPVHVIFGRQGDSLHGHPGAVYADGGAGADKLYGGAAADTLLGGDGKDFLSSGPGSGVSDVLSAGSGNDIVQAYGPDIVDCGPGDDILFTYHSAPLTTAPTGCEDIRYID